MEVATRHPAKFTDAILDAAADLLLDHPEIARVLDPFAGTGKGVEFLRQWYEAVGIELEPEWAAQSEHVTVGSALDLPFEDETFDAVFTSPTYGNRMADHHEARDDSRRNTYRHAIGRPLSVGSSAVLQWGDEYRVFHEKAWREALRVLKPGGYFLLNCKDHIRGGVRQYVTEWHVLTLVGLGCEVVEGQRVKCPGNRQGANGALRIDHESLCLLRKP